MCNYNKLIFYCSNTFGYISFKIVMLPFHIYHNLKKVLKHTINIHILDWAWKGRSQRAGYPDVRAPGGGRRRCWKPVLHQSQPWRRTPEVAQIVGRRAPRVRGDRSHSEEEAPRNLLWLPGTNRNPDQDQTKVKHIHKIVTSLNETMIMLSELKKIQRKVRIYFQIEFIERNRYVHSKWPWPHFFPDIWLRNYTSLLQYSMSVS